LEDGKHWNKFVNHFSFSIVPHLVTQPNPKPIYTQLEHK
jgi:hypothetical protein